jgi:hypothetical protein
VGAYVLDVNPPIPQLLIQKDMLPIEFAAVGWSGLEREIMGMGGV